MTKKEKFEEEKEIADNKKAKNEEEKEKEKEPICKSCKFFDRICKHKSNIIIHINKKIEKEVYKSKELKTECKYFE